MMESEFRAVERMRTRRRAVERLVELMRQRRAVGADRWFVQHTYAHEDAKRLAERLAELFGTEPEFISEVGPVSQPTSVRGRCRPEVFPGRR
jgi:fatty acid-binding protein DegV